MIFKFMRVEVCPELKRISPDLTSLDITASQITDTGFESKLSFYAVSKEEVAELGKELIALSERM